ncbi:MAG: SDR family oxidoreductase [Undibacterium sp.]|uniref:NAD-dependent epimerase/dehydratase family protein n=1 Tax=Undibacterium sp. TaxID=1914977 RepID=UPI002728FEB4|nr:SDR family oxidoreductase [Undibacterium sp.]MDO8651588.1 SDR family oxidoreductase [Undibacterium sp.]
MKTGPRATLVGGRGFIGRHLHLKLIESAWSCYVPERDDPNLTQTDLGHVFYCAGLTADFRQRPYATVEAHIQVLAHILQRCKFTSLTYLSSTRVYAGANSTDENAALTVKPYEPGDLYNLSKLMGESLCLNSGRAVRVVRLSNVYGQGMPEQNFLSEILFAAANEKKVEFRNAADSQKDYISIHDVVHYLPLIASQGEIGIYNLAHGKNVAHLEIARILQNLGVPCNFAANAQSIQFSEINIAKLQQSFGLAQHDLASDLPALYQHYCETT